MASLGFLAGGLTTSLASSLVVRIDMEILKTGSTCPIQPCAKFCPAGLDGYLHRSGEILRPLLDLLWKGLPRTVVWIQTIWVKRRFNPYNANPVHNFSVASSSNRVVLLASRGHINQPTYWFSSSSGPAGIPHWMQVSFSEMSSCMIWENLYQVAKVDQISFQPLSIWIHILDNIAYDTKTHT